MNVKEDLKFCENAKKGSGGRVWVGVGGRVLGVQMDKWGRGRVGEGGQGGCERRIKVFVKIKKNIFGGGGGGVGSGQGWGRGGGGQGGCERRIEVSVEMQKKIGGGGCQVWPGMGGGSRVGGWSIGRGLVGSNVWGRDCCGVWGM